MSNALLTVIYGYISLIAISAISIFIFQLQLWKSLKRIPKNWHSSGSLKRLRLGSILMLIYVTLQFCSESSSIYLSKHMCTIIVGILNDTLSFPVLFLFFSINTQQRWKKYAYAGLYFGVVGYYLMAGFYYPTCTNSATIAFVGFGAVFLAALLHLTELLVNPKTEHYPILLKITLVILIYNLLIIITNAFTWSQTSWTPIMEIISYAQFAICASQYLTLAIIFILESRKLRKVPIF